ncbi:MAG: nicotinate-nicotinamide nucleotide adenylyltransferase [Proteobacteria bacterium]|nr:nicotinate-nicotinamide nucleotide adenylyltransferase [Pseudomonadota bacterium]
MNKSAVPTNTSLPFRNAPSVIIFGGTFDPPHAGHAACLKALAEQFTTSKILVVPAAEPPPTNGKIKKPVLSFNDRLELCRLMLVDIGSPAAIEVSDIEGSLTAPNFTVNTLEALLESAPKKKHGSALAITIGADQFAAFETWHQAERILELADLILVPRNGEILTWPTGKLSKQARIWTLNVKTPQASSTVIRQAMESKKPIPAGWLTPKVFSRLQELTSKAIEPVLDSL